MLLASMERKDRSVALVGKRDAQNLRKHLEMVGLWDCSRRLLKQPDDRVAIPVKSAAMMAWKEHLKPEMGLYEIKGVKFEFADMELEKSKKSIIQTPYMLLVEGLQKLLRDLDIDWTNEIEADLPTSWEKHGDLVLFNNRYFQNEIWSTLGESLWTTVAHILGCKRVAQKSVICSDSFRSPQVALLYGSNGWVNQRDNGIRCSYDITKCMYSSGNISEKLRISKFNCQGETIVDLYAGIGYFTLPYLVHAGASLVHACEWNPHALSALRHNLTQNKVAERCVVHAGDNRQVCPRGVADRVNLGLIPSSESGWQVACGALKPHSGGVLHIHGNVITSKQLSQETRQSLTVVMDIYGNAVVTESPKIEQCVLTRFDTHPSCDSLQTQQINGTSAQKHTDGQTINADYHDTLDGLPSNKCTSPKQQCGKVQQGQMAEQQKSGETANVQRRRSDVLLTNATHLSMTNDKSQSNSELTNGGSTDIGKCDNMSGISDLNSQQSDSEIKSMTGISLEGIETDSYQCSHQGARVRREQWYVWAKYVSDKIKRLLVRVHGTKWTCKILHIEHVKSYAPNNDHVVLDLECSPCSV